MALEFAAAGADVVINWLDDEGAAQRVAEEVSALGRRAILVNADVGQIEQAQTMVSTAQKELGPIDVLINNAGVFPRVPFLEMTERDWDHVLGCVARRRRAVARCGENDRVAPQHAGGMHPACSLGGST
jgi:NAD(P)-dependent dehydrogenase (short-subunit alcohol dehydrogenase family)